MPQARRQILIAVSGMFQPLYAFISAARYTGMLAISCINDAVSSQKGESESCSPANEISVL